MRGFIHNLFRTDIVDERMHIEAWYLLLNWQTDAGQTFWAAGHQCTEHENYTQTNHLLLVTFVIVCLPSQPTRVMWTSHVESSSGHTEDDSTQTRRSADKVDLKRCLVSFKLSSCTVFDALSEKMLHCFGTLMEARIFGHFVLGSF